jgi:hypothetical protein
MPAAVAKILGGTVDDKGQGNAQMKGPGGAQRAAKEAPPQDLLELALSLKSLTNELKKEITSGMRDVGELATFEHQTAHNAPECNDQTPNTGEVRPGRSEFRLRTICHNQTKFPARHPLRLVLRAFHDHTCSRNYTRAKTDETRPLFRQPPRPIPEPRTCALMSE